MVIISSGDSGILDEDVQALQRTLHTLAEVLDVVITLKIDLPDLNDALSSSRRLYIIFCNLAFLDRSACDDELLAIQPDIVARSFFAQAGVGSCDDNGLACAVVGRHWRCHQELAVEEFGEVAERHYVVLWRSVVR